MWEGGDKRDVSGRVVGGVCGSVFLCVRRDGVSLFLYNETDGGSCISGQSRLEGQLRGSGGLSVFCPRSVFVRLLDEGGCSLFALRGFLTRGDSLVVVMYRDPNSFARLNTFADGRGALEGLIILVRGGCGGSGDFVVRNPIECVRGRSGGGMVCFGGSLSSVRRMIRRCLTSGC